MKTLTKNRCRSQDNLRIGSCDNGLQKLSSPDKPAAKSKRRGLTDLQLPMLKSIVAAENYENRKS